MVKIKKIHLKNYCGFRDTTLDFTKADGSIKNLILLYGTNGSGKSTTLEAINIAANAFRYEGRETDLSFLPITYNPDYSSYLKVEQRLNLAKAYTMEINAIFDEDGIEKNVQLSSIDKMGVKKNELSKSLEGNCHFLNVDSPMNLQRFQLIDDAIYTQRFIDMAKSIYGYNCELSNKIKDKYRGLILDIYTDFILHKYGNRVHYKKFSMGEKKITKFLETLCDPVLMSKIALFIIDSAEKEIYWSRHSKFIDALVQNFPDKQFIIVTHSGDMIRHVEKTYGQECLYDIEQYLLRDLGLTDQHLIT